jgi:hypothetical protein
VSTASERVGVPVDLEERGRDIAPAAETCSAIIVMGDDPSDAARVALGIAREQARHRRVAVVDLAGETPALQELLPADAVHGLVDGIEYGVSLGRIAYPADPAGRLSIVPSGAGPLDQGALVRSARWRTIVQRLRDDGALVLCVAPANMPGLGELQRVVDGAVPIGDARVPDAARVLARVADDDETTPVEAAPSAAPPSVTARNVRRMPRRHVVWLSLAGAAVVFTVTYRLARPSGQSAHPPAAVVEQDGAFTGGPAPTSPASTAPAMPGIVVANPADSSAAAMYTIALVAFNTAPAAQARLDQDNAQHLPAVTISHLTFGADSARWYRVSTGAFPSRASADSLLTALRKRGLVGPAAGRVVRAPFAVQVQTNVALADAHALASAYRTRGIPVYALRQTDGTLTLYAGAFETPAQAAILVSILHADGEQAPVVYRTGGAL